MGSANQRTGKVFIRINGDLVESKPGATLKDAMGLERDADVGTQVNGYTEKAVVPTMTFSISHGSSVSLATLAAMVDTTLTFECDSGPTFIMRNAWYANGMELKDGGNGLALVFQGKKCQEQLT